VNGERSRFGELLKALDCSFPRYQEALDKRPLPCTTPAVVAQLSLFLSLIRRMKCPCPSARGQVLSFAALVILMWGPSRSAAQDDLAADVPAYNDYVARTFLIEVEPLVEKYTGWECEWPVPFQLVSRAQYVEETIRDVTKEMAKQSPGIDEKLVATQFRPFFEVQAAGLLGRYSTTSRKILFLPGNLKPTMRALGLEHRFMRDLIEVIMAHELTHSVQDAKYKFTDRLLTARSKDEMTAWIMLVEGHATWVQERVADELGLSESAQRFAEQMLNKHQQFGTYGRDDNALGAANIRGYIQGKVFVEAIYDKGGIKAVQRLFDNPPKSPRFIEDPDSYLSQVAKK
jgi:hypothetical protein